MTGEAWMRFCIEHRTSKHQKEVMLAKRVNTAKEKRLVEDFRQKEKEWFTIIALDTTRRHTLTFLGFEGIDCSFVAEWSKKEKRWLYLMYKEDDINLYIPLKNCPY